MDFFILKELSRNDKFCKAVWLLITWRKLIFKNLANIWLKINCLVVFASKESELANWKTYGLFQISKSSPLEMQTLPDWRFNHLRRQNWKNLILRGVVFNVSFSKKKKKNHYSFFYGRYFNNSKLYLKH